MLSGYNFQKINQSVAGPGNYRITLRRQDETRVVTLTAEDRQDATFKAEERNSGWYMIIAQEVTR